MLNVAIIGYGHRIAHMAAGLAVYRIPYRVAAVADPRADELRASDDPLLAHTAFFPSADDLVAACQRGELSLDGIMIGTRCYLHTEMACKVAPLGLPVFLEKPVAITFDQVKRLDAAYRDHPAPTVVSFPLRLTPIVQRVRELLEADTIGTVEQVAAHNDVPYGDTYFSNWYRNFDQVGGLFLQKATHDLDYVAYLMGQRPALVAALKAQRVYGGEKPFDLRCVDCEEWETCPESPFNLFYQRYAGEAVNDASERMCVFSRGIENEDISQCLVQYENGAQASYTQNVFARFGAARRGARLYGYRGTIAFDWYENAVRVYSHQSPKVETITFTGEMPHFGGDRELCLDFLRAMRDGTPSRSPLSAGIESALTCLWSRESAETHRYCQVHMPS